MATLTTILSLRKPDGVDFVNRVLDLNNNWDAIDALFHTTTGHKHTGAGTHGTRLLVEQNFEVNREIVEAATLDTLDAASRLINNMNRIRYWITQLSGQALGTVGTSVNTHVTSFHATGFAVPSGGVAAAAVAGVATTGIRSDAVLAHGAGYLPDAHHNKLHAHSATDGSGSVLANVEYWMSI